jgi:hypothetical protein
MEEPLVLDDIEGWRLLIVEGAKTAVLTALAGKAHALSDQISERNPRP